MGKPYHYGRSKWQDDLMFLTEVGISQYDKHQHCVPKDKQQEIDLA
jgi:hypothetical protein